MVKNLPANAEDTGSIPGWGRSPGGGNWQPTPVFLPGKSAGQRSLCSPWGCKESNMTQQGNNDKQQGNYEHWAQERGEDWRKGKS